MPLSVNSYCVFSGSANTIEPMTPRTLLSYTCVVCCTLLEHVKGLVVETDC